MFSVFDKLAKWLLFFLPQQKRLAIERWLRGWNDYRHLQQADCVIVSFGKSGRTWLRVIKLFRFSGRQMMVPTDRNNPDSFKVRRAKIGGYRDYFDDQQTAQLDAVVERQFSPRFGYKPFQFNSNNYNFPVFKEFA